MLPTEFNPGDRLPASVLTEIVRAIRRLKSIEVVAPMTIDNGGSTIIISPNLPDIWWIKLTAAGTGGKYDWTRQIPATSFAWIASPGGETGTAAGTDPAFEVTGNYSISLSPNPIVRAWREPVTNDLRFQMGTC